MADERIAKLEAEVAELKATIEKMHRGMTFQSPDGDFSVQVSTSKTHAGIWINDARKDSAVALYNVREQGPCVGVYGKTKSTRGMDVALAVGKEGGGLIQLVDADRKMHHFDSADLKPCIGREPIAPPVP